MFKTMISILISSLPEERFYPTLKITYKNIIAEKGCYTVVRSPWKNNII